MRLLRLRLLGLLLRLLRRLLLRLLRCHRRWWLDGLIPVLRRAGPLELRVPGGPCHFVAAVPGTGARGLWGGTLVLARPRRVAFVVSAVGSVAS
ncbi:hypothetical protein [Nocardia iowensis]|uniref:Secreted protein n=1 Tax=Nocardia iowensis TaxID=204891 RepID=A0ABX8RI50_NOCIO|nr:hypothetical protein [Nocardia iowensis]QXN89303.1 hypothetical protein KV110_27700 [Nocardia iowensis]